MNLFILSLVFCVFGLSYSIGDLSSCGRAQWILCATSLGSKIYSLHQWNDRKVINLLGHQCTGSMKGRVRQVSS